MEYGQNEPFSLLESKTADGFLVGVFRPSAPDLTDVVIYQSHSWLLWGRDDEAFELTVKYENILLNV